MAILAVNAGSSTLKFSVYALENSQVRDSVLTGAIEGLEPGGTPVLTWRHQQGQETRLLRGATDTGFDLALQSLAQLLAGIHALPRLQAIAHRVVHGGRNFRASVRVTDEVLAQLAQLNSLAPLHQPQNLQGIRAFQKAFPDTLQIACFDTAFHATLAAADYSFALPQSLSDQGVRRYGFHGLSYQYVMSVLGECITRAGDRVLMAHLGNGASLCAARAGMSCATSMGFSALDGLVMGTRSGSIDAGVLLYLMEQGWDHDRLQKLLYKQSGLLGVSGISADMRTLRADGRADAHRAIELFTHRVVRESGAMVACLGGLDVLAFSGGIGEHDVVLRSEVCQRLSWLGVSLDPSLNEQATGHQVSAIHAAHSQVEIWVVPTDEGLVAAREAARLICWTNMA